MNKTSKVIITIIAIVLVLVIFVGLSASMSDSGGNVPGIIGLILFGGLYFGLKAMWKDENKDNDKNNNSLLQN